jgi:hypothetical protein
VPARDEQRWRAALSREGDLAIKLHRKIIAESQASANLVTNGKGIVKLSETRREGAGLEQ